MSEGHAPFSDWSRFGGSPCDWLLTCELVCHPFLPIISIPTFQETKVMATSRNQHEG